MGTTRQNGSRKNTASTKKKNTAARETARKAAEREESIGKEIGLVILLIVSVLLFVSNFGVGGVVGNFLSGILFGCFGLFAYVLPVAVLLLTMFYLANRENLVANIKIAGAALGCVAVNALLHMITAAESNAGKLGDVFTYCRENKTGGGLLGGGISMLLQNAFGTIGTYLILAGVLIVCVVIVTERSFVRGMTKGSRKVYESARYDMERRREAAEIRREQKKEQRLERKVSGVTSDVTIPRRPEETLLLEDEEEEQEDFAEPEQAVLPPEETKERKVLFPVRESVPQKSSKAGESFTGGIQEISFSEEALPGILSGKPKVQYQRPQRAGGGEGTRAERGRAAGGSDRAGAFAGKRGRANAGEEDGGRGYVPYGYHGEGVQVPSAVASESSCGKGRPEGYFGAASGDGAASSADYGGFRRQRHSDERKPRAGCHPLRSAARPRCEGE